MRRRSAVHGPSPTQREALERAAAGGGVLHRWPGGYWRTEPYGGTGGPLPTSSWHTGTTTVWALETRGWVERANHHVEEWKDNRALTAAGREVARPTERT